MKPTSEKRDAKFPALAAAPSSLQTHARAFVLAVVQCVAGETVRQNRETSTGKRDDHHIEQLTSRVLRGVQYAERGKLAPHKLSAAVRRAAIFSASVISSPGAREITAVGYYKRPARAFLSQAQYAIMTYRLTRAGASSLMFKRRPSTVDYDRAQQAAINVYYDVRHKGGDELSAVSRSLRVFVETLYKKPIGQVFSINEKEEAKYINERDTELENWMKRNIESGG